MHVRFYAVLYSTLLQNMVHVCALESYCIVQNLPLLYETVEQ